MSASLVGSEMCIRDRPTPCPVALPGLVLLSPGAGKVQPVHAVQHQGPVSYTHLTLPTICSV
eukprot:2479305-Alexandrium_andersonii.AAC.1